MADWSKMKYGRFIAAAGGWQAFQTVLRAAAEVARKHGVSLANVATRWVLEQRRVAGVIIGARLGEAMHATDNRRLFSFALDAEDRASSKKPSPRPGPFRRLRRRIPTAAVPDRLRRSFPPPLRSCQAIPAAAGRARRRARADRIVLGGHRRLLPGAADRRPDSGFGHHGDRGPVAGGGTSGRRGADYLHSRPYCRFRRVSRGRPRTLRAPQLHPDEADCWRLTRARRALANQAAHVVRVAASSATTARVG